MGTAGSKFNKSGVLTGQLDAYCLVCEATLEHTALEDHILLETHIVNLDKNGLVEKFKKESVRKVPNGYYCQLCNIFLRSLAKVKIHMADTVHQNSMTSGSNLTQARLDLVKKDGNVIAFGCLNIDINAWNAIGKETCFVCDEDIKQGAIEAHIELSSHKIKLIQVFAMQSGWFLYRKIGESSMQCLTCNQIVTESKLQSHFNSKKHEVLFTTASNGKIKKQDVSCYDINKNLKIKNFHGEDNNICHVCNAYVAKNMLNTHINNFHHKNMVKLHEQWVERKKWVTEQAMPAIPLTFEEKPESDFSENGWETETSEQEGHPFQDLLINIALKKFISDSNKKAKGKVNVENKNGEDKENKSPNVENGEDSEYHTADENGDEKEVNEEVASRDDKDLAAKPPKEGIEVDAKNLVEDSPNSNEPVKDNCVPKTKNGPKLADVPKNETEIEGMHKAVNEPKIDAAETEVEPKQDKVSKEEFDKVVASCMKDFKMSTTGGNSDKVNHNMEISNKAKRDEISNGVQEDQTIFEYANEYNIKYHPKGITTCTVCDIQLKGTLEDMKSHIGSFKHKRNYFKTSKITPNNYDTVRMSQSQDSVKSIVDVINSSIIVNNRHSITCTALMAISREGAPEGYARCHLCSKTVMASDRATHIQTDLHQRLQRESRIITSFEHDFVREVRHGVYQCGYCNLFYNSWDQLLLHLMGLPHRRRRLAAEGISRRHCQAVMTGQVDQYIIRD